MRVHVLGIGSVGTLLSTHLRLAHPTTPITLLLRPQSSLDSFWLDKGGHRRGGQLLVHHPTQPSASLAATAFNTELAIDEPSSPILSLIITLKCPAILPALKTLKRRLGSESTVVLLHNGMGVHDQLVRDLFLDEKDRPTFILGSTTHGVRTKDRFEVVHHQGGHGGEMTFAVVPSTGPPATPDSLDQTIDLLRGLPSPLQPNIISYKDMLSKLLHKLVLNSIINPLTALLSVPNGSLSSLPSALALIRSLATETASILAAAHPDLARRLTPETVERDVLALAKATSSNRSSMLQDLDAGRETEIDYISGYLVEMGKKVGAETKVNEMVRGLVKAREEASRETAGG